MPQIKFTRISSDSNGNPRYVCHFLSFLTDNEQETIPAKDRYAFAIKRANKLGGRKYNNKQYGGGIVFQSYNTEELSQQITETLNATK